MRDKDIKRVLLAARQGPYNHVVPNLIPGWTYDKLGPIVAYCHDKGLVQTIETTHSGSPFAELILRGITADGEDYLEGLSSWSRLKRLGRRFWAVVVIVIAVLAGLVQITSYDKKVPLYRALFDTMRHLLHKI